MKHLLAALLLALLPLIAHAQVMFYEDEHMLVRLSLDPCANPVLTKFVADSASGPAARAALTTFRGVDFVSCWTVTQDGNVFLADEAGDAGVLPIGSFTRKRGAVPKAGVLL